MSDNRETVKLIIEIPKAMYEHIQNGTYCGTLYKELKNGIPLNDVIDKIDKADDDLDGYDPNALYSFADRVSDILDNIGKAESEDKE